MFALLWAGPAVADDRLVTACQVAVAAQGHDVALSFPDATRVGNEVHLRFAFDNVLGRHAGAAVCGFRDAKAPAPPSLSRFTVMGDSSPSMFLIAHHAVWNHFTAPLRPPPDEADPPAEPRTPPRPRLPLG